jgi:hypothetical protein
MIINFSACGISQNAHKLTRKLALMKKKKKLKANEGHPVAVLGKFSIPI